jgi:class 3 adenylate cyclase/tetratricopeptide (TPR) repeat protein
VAICPRCGHENADEAPSCAACGSTLVQARASSPEARRTVTVVFADLSESTHLGEQLDPEVLRHVMSRYFDAASLALERHGGTVEKFIGDAVMAVFGSPAVHEDDALRAVRAAVEMRAAVDVLSRELERERGVQLRLQIGVNTGEVVVGDSSTRQMLATGDAVNVAARLQQVAGPGDILAGEATRRLVRDAVRVEPVGALELKGKADGVVAWRVLGVDDVPAFARRFDSPLIGRERQLAQIQRAFEHATEQRKLYLFTLLGDAGIGKSRLAAEFQSTVSEVASVVGGRCLPYGDGITFWPLTEIVAGLPGGDEDPGAAIAEAVEHEEAAPLIAERMAVALGRSHAQASAEETFWAVRKLFEALARERPLVVVFEDIHWGEPTFFDLVDHLADWSRDAPVVLLCLARSELLEKRPGWAGGKLNATTLLLEPLTEMESSALIDHLTRDAPIPEAAHERILERAEGNPLYVEQMLAMLAESPDRALPEIPPTIQALLAARLDRLSASERAVIERAAVVGKRFWIRALVALLSSVDPAAVAEDVQKLVRKELIRPDRPILAGEEGYRFQHLLIRDAAYAGIPKEVRSDLHERFAGLVEEAAGERLSEVEEIVGYHLEQAFRYRRELRAVDERAQAVSAQASGHLAAAGRRALGRGDATAATNLLGRAVVLSPEDAPGRASLLADLGAALVLAGEFVRADAALTRGIDAAAAAGDRKLELHSLLERAFLRALTDPVGGVEGLRDTARRAVAELDELGDEQGLAKAWRRIADVSWMVNQWDEQERALERALEHAERAGDAREMAGALMRLPMAIYYGPTPVPEAIRRAEAILERASGARVVQSTALVCLAGLHAMSGRFDIARSVLADGRAIVAELGFRVWLAGFSLLASEIEMLADDPSAAEEELRRGYAALEAMGDRGLLSTVASELARAVYAQGGLEEADRLTRVSEELAGAGDVTAQISWRAVRAKVAARQGDVETGEALAREALRLAELTDGLDSQGRALVDLAEVLRLAGRDAEARAELERALDDFERKGNLVSAGKVRAALNGVAGDASPAAGDEVARTRADP